MYEARELWIAYQKEKKRNHQHEVIASVSALTFFGIIAIVITSVI